MRKNHIRLQEKNFEDKLYICQSCKPGYKSAIKNASIIEPPPKKTPTKTHKMTLKNSKPVQPTPKKTIKK